jgi:ribosomal-protein-alanine N-acetyltransferase
VNTARLRLEPLGAQNEAQLRRLLQDDRVAATLGGVRSDADVAAHAARHAAHWQEHGFGYWALRDRATGAFVGRGGLQRRVVAGSEEVEVGWAIVPERWNEGLATELAEAAVQQAERLGLPSIVAFTQPENGASRRVMEKAGFRYERDIVHADLPHVLYRRVIGPR